MRSALSFAVQALLSTVVVATSVVGADEPEVAHFLANAGTLYRRSSLVAPPAGADVLVLDDEETLVFDTDGKVARSRYFLYKVLTQRGAEGWGDISSTWEPWHQTRPSLRARVITSDNAVHLLDANTITDAPAKENADNVFSDRRVMRAPLPAVAQGSLIEEEQVSTESAPFFGAGTVERFYFGGSVPVRHTRLILDAPAALPLRYDIRLLPDLKPQRSEAEGRVRIAFDYGPMDSLQDADTGLPSDVPAYPSITFSTGDSWPRVADEYGKIVDKQIADANLKSLVGKLIAGKNSRDAKVGAILQYLGQEIRYTGVEFGESALIPHSPSETIARKYGDCKDKASLLVAMLRTADINAYIALLKAGTQEDVLPGLPGMGMFDHAIVFVPGYPDFWIDATDEYARLGEIPIADQDRLALIARPGSNVLLRTYASSSADNILTEKREIYLAENGPARIIETSQPHGSSESSYRRSYADKENKSAKEDLANYMKSQYLAEKLDRMDRSDPDDLSKQFELILESDRSKRGFTDLNIAVAAIRFDGLFSRLPSDLRQREAQDDSKTDKDSGQKTKKKRTSDYQLPEAFATEWHYTIVPPTGFSPKPLPPNTQLSLGPSILTEDFAADKDGVVHATLRFDTLKRRLTVSEAADLRDKVVQLIEREAIVIYFEPIGQRLLSQGNPRKAVQAYRDLIALHPKEAIHHLQLADFLLAAGLGESARDEAKAAVKLEPSSALAEKTLADILEYDLVGRKLRPGSDNAGAEAALRRAEQLDHDDRTTIGNLAILLEYNQWGLRYGPGAKLEDAVAEYRKLTAEQLADLGLRNNLAFALFYAGEFSGARKDALSLSPQPTALIVACEAVLHGSQAALAEGRERTTGEEQFKSVAQAAGWMLANLHKYGLAADLLEAGASGANASETAAAASVIRRTQPHEQLLFRDDAAGVAMRFELLTDDPEMTLDQLRSISSRNGMRAFATQAVVEQIAKQERETVSHDARNGQFRHVSVDTSISMAQPKVQGSDETGYKVILWASQSYKSSVYIVKEDNHYKVLATSRYPHAIGLEALDRLAVNDSAGARVLLDWLREDMHLAGGDDPVSDAPFPRFWAKGRNADPAAIRLAAALILVETESTAARGVSILEAAKASATTDSDRLNLASGLCYGYSRLRQYEKAVDYSSELVKEYPESKWAFGKFSYDLRAVRRFDEAERIAEERLQHIPGDIDAMRALVASAIARRDYAKIPALSQRILAEGNVSASDLNEVAWSSLFTGKVDQSDIEAALKAANSGKKNARILHTLGCVYAEAGKTKEARDILLEAMDLLDLDEPDSNYWFAFGRIAEQYDERDVAIADYNRAIKPANSADIPDSSYRLAQIRLEALRNQK